MSIISNAKEIADLVKKLGDAELYRKIIELEGEIIELTRENRTLEERVDDLSSSLRVKQDMRFEAPFYFMGEDKSPYCSKCWDADSSAVRLFCSGGNIYDCPACKNRFWPADQ